MSGLRVWVDAHAVGFGTSAFMVTGSGQWATEASTVTKRVPGGNKFVTQYLGRGPETVTYELAFASVDAFHNFKLLIGTSNTLTLPADVAALSGRSPVVIGGVKYDRLTATVLASIDPSSVLYQNGGVVRCSATFVRAVSETSITTLWMGDAV